MDEYYGFHYWDNQYTMKKVQTYLPIGQIELEGLLSEIVSYLPTVVEYEPGEDAFLPQYGYIKELSLYNGEIKKSAPAKVGLEKYQAFIFKRKGDVLVESSEGKGFYILNDVRIDIPLSIYDISIIEI